MMESLGFVAFAGAGAALIYTFTIYPLAAHLLARFPVRTRAERDWQPAVSLIITAHNEERAIPAKLENTLSLNYPADKLEIVVSSDASTDRTEAIVETYADRGVRLVSHPRRSGKTVATQRGVSASRGEILVFSDATGLYERAALQHLVRALSDPAVGCVSGRVEYTYSGSLIARGFRIYQSLVKAQRRDESALGVLTSVSGSIHAARKNGFPSIDSHQNYDILLPMEMAGRGLAVVYRQEAVSVESARSQPDEEFAARVRAGVVAFSALSELRRRGWLLRSPLFLWALFSGKIMRWLSPVWFLSLLCGHALLALDPGPWRMTFIPHAGMYALAALAAILPSSRLTRLCAGPLFVGTLCAAFLVALVRYLIGERMASWESSR